MASREQMASVARECSYYENTAIVSVANWDSKSCESCEHLKNKKCEMGVFDEILTGLDQS